MRIVVSFIFILLFLTACGQGQDEIPWHNHATDHTHVESEEPLLLRDGDWVIMPVGGPGMLDDIGGAFYVDEVGALWLRMKVCHDTSYDGERYSFSVPELECNELATDFEGQMLHYKLADYPTLIDGR